MKALKFLSVILISFVIIWLISGVGILVSLSITKHTNFNDKHYSTIDELHEDYKTFCYSDSDVNIYPNEIMLTIPMEDFVFVVCTEKDKYDAEIEDELLIYAIKETEDGYILEVPFWGESAIPRARVQLKEEYSSYDYHYMALQYVTENDSLCFGFMYKNATDTRQLYFDGVKMKETECTNPFTGEEFILCYAASDKTYNVLESFITPKDERHTLEIQ